MDVESNLPRLVDVASLVPYEANARTHSAVQIEQIKASIRRFGFVGVLAYQAPDQLKIGHGRRVAAMQLWAGGETIYGPGKREAFPSGQLPAVDVTGLSDDEIKALVLADNQLALNAGWDEALLRDELRALLDADFDVPVIGFDQAELDRLLNPPIDGKSGFGNLAAEFLIAPFSVLSARDGWWQERKRAWLSLGIKSEVGRGENLIKRSLQDRLAIIVPGPYQAALDFIAAGRAESLTDDQIIERAGERWGKPKTHEAIPGGAGANAAYRKGGRKSAGRTFGQDMLDNEGGPRLERGVRRSTGAQPLPGQPGTPDRPADLGGVTMSSLSSHPRYYEQKNAAEAKVGRKLTPEEFEREHWVMPDSEIASGTSIFDPVLCELAYRWFCPPAGVVLDPFAGGSVRGIVASALGRSYVGVDLRPEQVDANAAQWPGIARAMEGAESTPVPDWRVGDSLAVVPTLELEADFVFTCPPYGDLEVYSDDPADISTMEVEEFDRTFAAIIAASIAKLRPDRFAAVVVGDYRDKRGLYRNFVSKTISAFESAGTRLYNEAILVTSVGSLPIRAAKQFRSGRKLGKTHQNFLVFVKGDPRRATKALGAVDVERALAMVERTED